MDLLRGGRSLLLTTCLLLLSPGVALQRAAAQVLPFESYTVKDGLLSNDIRVITQDADGYLWIGTRDGVSRFDGRQFVNYTTADGLPSGSIGEIVEDRTADKKSFWILGSRGVLLRWSPGHSEPVKYDSTLPWMHRITTICQDHAGTLWAGTEDTLVQIVGDTIRAVSAGISTRYPDIIKEQGDSVLWITSRSGD
ncbi:MAG TPA: two-component regulator propeller domain-containing protein, partial [Geobacteraceae bacterium]